MSNLRFVSTFLSHSSADKPFVEQVAEHLCRRGVLPWLDKNELALGPLDTALKQAVQNQSILVIFLSEASLSSDWCKDELRWAIEAESGIDHLIPVYLGDPLELVKRHALLKSRFLHADGDRVNQLGCYDPERPTTPDPDKVAQSIAKKAYERSIKPSWSDIAIVLDQRGQGLRRGRPSLPENIERLEIPVLTFRPSLEPRQQRELLVEFDWEDMAKAITESLSSALGTVRGEPRKVRVLGHAQTGLVWLVGKHLDRTTSAELYGYGQDDLPVTNKGQDRLAPLSGGTARAERLAGILGDQNAMVAVGVGIKEQYANAVQRSLPDDTPLMWIESNTVSDSTEAMDLIKDIVASINRLRQDHGVSEVMLFWTRANHVALLAAANLTSHVIPTIRYMEWDHDQAKYIHLPMP